jgi:hypothetical protein
LKLHNLLVALNKGSFKTIQIMKIKTQIIKKHVAVQILYDINQQWKYISL